MLARQQERQTSVLARRYLDVRAGVLGDGLARAQRLALAERVRVVLLALFERHVEHLRWRMVCLLLNGKLVAAEACQDGDGDLGVTF